MKLLFILLFSIALKAQTFPFDALSYIMDDDFHPVNSITSAVNWAYYESDDLSTITKDGSNLVSSWADKSGNGHNLNATGGARPTWQSTGILFNGTEDNLKATADATLTQPITIYLVIKQVTWTADDRLFDGNAINSGMVFQKNPGGTSPEISAYAGTVSTVNTNLVLDTYGILKVVFSGASSVLQVNNTTAITGNFGTNNMGGFTLGSNGSQTQLGNIQVKAGYIYKGALSAGDDLQLKSYLSGKYGITL